MLRSGLSSADRFFMRMRILVILVVTFVFSLAFQARAMAATAADPQANWLNISDPINVVRVLGLLIPIVTALVTKSSATSGQKAVVTLVLSALTSTVVYLVANDGSGYDWAGFVNAFINTFVPAIVAYYGLLKPTNITGSIAAKTADVGIGSSTPAA